MIQAVNSGKSPEAASRQFLDKLRNMKVPQATPQAKNIFETRNEMIYSVYKDGAFSAPEGKGRESQWNELRQLAEDSIGHAEVLLKGSLISLKNGQKVDSKVAWEKSTQFLIEGFKKANLIIVKSDSKKNKVN